MPEFMLNSDARFEALPEFTKGYVEAMFFTNGDTGADDEDKLNRLGTARLTAKALPSIRATCAAFARTHADLLTAAYEHPGYGPREAGHDLWFTRQGHGAGYWDSGLPRPLSDALTDAAKALKECEMEVWRGWIYERGLAPN